MDPRRSASRSARRITIWTSWTVLMSRPPRAIAPASFEQGGVEAIEVLGSQMSKWHTAQMGEHVELDEAPVAIPGARSERQLLGRQPLHREVDAEGWAHSPSVDALTLGGSERGRQLLGLLLVSAGRDAIADAPVR